MGVRETKYIHSPTALSFSKKNNQSQSENVAWYAKMGDLGFTLVFFSVVNLCLLFRIKNVWLKVNKTKTATRTRKSTKYDHVLSFAFRVTICRSNHLFSQSPARWE